MPIIEEMAELGVFGLTIPEQYGGLGMAKMAMCVVTEELRRGYIGVGSLGTRSEIAAPNSFAWAAPMSRRNTGCRSWPRARSCRPRCSRSRTPAPTSARFGPARGEVGDVYKITGNKTWITHAARTDLMTLLARTDPDTKDWKGLSMFLAEKPRGTDADPFPVKGMTGGEIEVLGYRGMKEYELGFDGFEVPATICSAARRARASSSSWRPSRARASRPRRGPSAWRRTRWSWA